MTSLITIAQKLQHFIIFYFFAAVSFVRLFSYLRSLYFGRNGAHVYRPISILVPAFNEEETIAHNVSSLLEIKYPQYEVLVISDGSTDSMVRNLISQFEMVPFKKVCKRTLETKPVNAVYRSISHPNLYLIDKDRGGKSDTLNAGINYSTYPIFCSVDADSILEEDALLRASRLFTEDSRVIAVGGVVRVINGSTVERGRVTKIELPKRLIERFQVIEYMRGFLAGRTAWNAFGSLFIISGTFSLLRKSAALAVGGYRNDSITEDMDIIVRLHLHFREVGEPYRITFIPDPICWTQAPSDWRSLLEQRNRWQRGLVKTLWNYRSALLNPKFGTVGLLGYPYFLIFEGLGPVVEILGYASVVLLYFTGLLSPEFAVLFFLVALLFGALLNVGSVLLENFLFKRYEKASALLKLVAFGFAEYFGYRQIVSVERVIATFQAGDRHWSKPRRKTLEQRA